MTHSYGHVMYMCTCDSTVFTYPYQYLSAGVYELLSIVVCHRLVGHQRQEDLLEVMGFGRQLIHHI